MMFDQQGKDKMGQSKKDMDLDAAGVAHDNINEGVEGLDGKRV